MARDIKKIDAKGRIFLPAKSRETIGNQVVVTNSMDAGFLCVYPSEFFEKFKQAIKKLSSWEGDAREIKRSIIGEAMDANVDAQGRIIISSELWDRIGAHNGDEICVFDLGDRVEICTKAFDDKRTRKSISSLVNDTKLEVPDDFTDF